MASMQRTEELRAGLISELVLKVFNLVAGEHNRVSKGMKGG